MTSAAATGVQPAPASRAAPRDAVRGPAPGPHSAAARSAARVTPQDAARGAYPGAARGAYPGAVRDAVPECAPDAPLVTPRGVAPDAPQDAYPGTSQDAYPATSREARSDAVRDAAPDAVRATSAGGSPHGSPGGSRTPAGNASLSPRRARGVAPDAAPPLRVGLVGYGPAGSFFHAPLIAATPGLVLDTIVTRSPERREQARAEHPHAVFADTAEELWARAGDLDLVVLASPNRTHVPLATAALEAGLPVVVDKPLAGTAAQARELAALAASRGLLLSVFQNRRWDSDFLTLRALLDRGGIGEPYRFESRFERWRPHLKGGWRESGDPADIGGLLYDLGSHLVDQALTLFGPARRVYAESDARRAGATADDDSFLAITHACGVRSHLWMSATAARLGPRFRVLGSEGGFVTYGLDPQEAALREGLRPGEGADWGAEPESAWGTVGADGSVRPVPSLPGDYPAFYPAVATALHDGTAPPVTALEAAAALDVIEAARHSAHEGKVVEL